MFLANLASKTLIPKGSQVSKKKKIGQSVCNETYLGIKILDQILGTAPYFHWLSSDYNCISEGFP